MWTIARLAPSMASKVRRINGSRVCTSTWIVTSSGMRFSSIRRRRKLNSVSAADGKPTSICLKPTRTSRSKNSIFSSIDIGCGRAWLPSRRSTEHHSGAWVSVWSGQVRSGRETGGNGRYFEREVGCILKKEKVGNGKWLRLKMGGPVNESEGKNGSTGGQP